MPVLKPNLAFFNSRFCLLQHKMENLTVANLVVMTLLLYSAAAQDNVIGYSDEEKKIVDILNQTLPGQCLVPRICLDKGQRSVSIKQLDDLVNYNICADNWDSFHKYLNIT